MWWPIDSKKEMAWAPPNSKGSVTAIPILPNEKTITWGMYLERMKDRVRMMQESHGSQSLEAYQDGMRELLGRDLYEETMTPADHVETQEFKEIMQEWGDVSPDQFPMKVEQESTPDNVRLDLTTWLELMK